MHANWTALGREETILYGCALNSASMRLAEMAGRVGFDTVWIELEHGSSSPQTAEALCVATCAGGALPLVRTAGQERIPILQALEWGARLLVVPMVNTPDEAGAVAQWAHYPPRGKRGYNTRSRGVGFGLGKAAALQQAAETGMVVLPQIETRQSAEAVEAILAIEGIDGVFVGPGDLSADLGQPGVFDNPELIELTCRCLGAARTAGKHAGILTGQGPLLTAALDAGADLAIVTSDLGAVATGWRETLQDLGRF